MDKYEILEALGEGKTSKVYLGRDMADHNKQVAIKLFRQEFLTEENGIKSVEQEI